MSNDIPGNEALLRLAIFMGIFTWMAIWEIARPRRRQSLSRSIRWPSNIGVLALNTLLLRLLFPIAAVGTALLARSGGWGLFNHLPLPGWLAVAGAIILLDLAIYLQHVMFHAVPAFWRLHRMHHSDIDIDVSTGGRFHPIEILFSMIIKIAVIAALGPPALGVLIFEILLSGTSLFNHANVRIPHGIDRLLRWFVVTPDMHRVHHSVYARETNSNFGFNLPWWDRLLGTYRDQPQDGHRDMKIGIDLFRDPAEYRLDRMLLQPAREGAGRYPITGRSD